jgi:hypothetical protein
VRSSSSQFSHSERLAVFFRRRSRLLTFVGAFIVFSTFVVREALRDRAKDLGDATDAAESIFLIRTDDRIILQGLTDIQTSLDNSAHTSGANARPMPGPELIKEKTQLFRQRLLSMRMTADNLARFVSKLPIDSPDEFLPLFQRLQKNLDTELTLADNLDQEADKLSALATSVTPDGAATQIINETAARITTIFDKINKQMANDTDAMDNAAGEALDYGERARNNYELLYVWFNRASYALFALGWGLALLSQIYRREGEVSEMNE